MHSEKRSIDPPRPKFAKFAPQRGRAQTRGTTKRSDCSETTREYAGGCPGPCVGFVGFAGSNQPQRRLAAGPGVCQLRELRLLHW
ncbi:MAG: hypothetical protein QOD54_540 [Sphingomonadales bacterium]|nr:hypothetical protein [Sphingomonadales bacterium]